MKYFLRILLTLVLAAAVVFGVYYYTNGNPFDNESKVKLTTVSQPAATEKNSNRVLIASLPDDDYYLYKGSKGVILTHGKKEYEFNNWSKLIDAETPEMRLANIDSDSDKELIIRAVSTKNESTGEYTYDIYVLKPTKSESGKRSYNVYSATQATWEEILNSQIREEIGQLKICKKILQISMNSKNKSISYDAKTGIAKNGFNGYARALQNGGSYMKFDSWSKGKGVYSINSKNEICVSVEVNIRYKETDVVQTAGHINFKLKFKDGNFYVKNKSMNFTPDDAYVVSDPRTASSVGWSYGENNSYKKTDSPDKIIDWVKYTPEYSADVFENTLSLADEQTDIKNISKIYITNSYLEMTAKSGFNFDEGARKSGDFSVIINKGTDNEYDIAYTAKIIEIKGVEMLRISFDKSYPQNEIETIEINYGAR